ncbi:prenyltransferase/squalene oxidase repeat-containing protein [Herpetosiphon llansteffanensis]|uniref:prenyltransferase/squalene oxidase repeat-containing protein n=1 Tax=Herpetosiphon llansteffanensis TaxID=2094568 RepID=UPI000D7C5769|nr:prenyltransferase/squalene oxidase repeat-containing protein [Herpetosiphon llansteffanensis]
MLRRAAIHRWLLVLMAVFVALPAAAQAPTEGANAAAWIVSQAQADGSFPGFGLGETADAVYALKASGLKVDTNVQSFVEKNASAIAAKPGIAAKFVLAELLLGYNPRSVGGVDLVAAVTGSYKADSGMYGGDVTTHALALLALNAAGAPVENKALNTVAAVQIADGSWSFSGDTSAGAGDTNTTALVIQALVAVGQGKSETVSKAVAYLQTQQNSDGGFPYSKDSSYGSATDANSTALVIQAIVATGGNPTAAPWATATGNPLSALLSLQNASGAFRYDAATPDDNAFATYQATPALFFVTYPLSVLATAPQPTAVPSTPMPNTPVATATPKPNTPITLPDTGAPSLPLWPVVVGLGLVCVVAGLGLRRIG